MASNQPPNSMQLPQMISQYQQNIEYLNNNIATIRRNLERPNITQEERALLKKQEQELQGKLTVLQTLITNLAPQLMNQNMPQRVLQPNQQVMNDNMSQPGSPATFQQQQQHQQQQQQQHQQQQPQQQQQQPQQPQQQQAQQTQQSLANFVNNPQIRAAQQQQALNKMSLAAAAAAAAHTSASQNPIQFSSPATSNPTTAFVNPILAASLKSNAPGAAALAAAAAVKNNGMFTFSANNNANVNTNSSNTNNNAPMIVPAPAPKPAAPSLDHDGVNRVLTKRKIQELVTQIDPVERLEPEVEDILLEIADEFIESVTTFACQLAKHRKSDTLEVRDVQLHLERNWNIRIPGFAADDIRPLRKPAVSSAHQSKIQAVNTAKSQLASNPKKEQ